MGNGFLIDGGAVWVLAEVRDLAFDFSEGALADWAIGWEFYWFFLAGAEVGENFEDFGDDVAGFVDDDAVADADVFALDFVLVVKGGAGDGGAVDEGWF